MNTTLILIQLLLAHILTDFVFQTKYWVEKKKIDGFKSVYYWGHIFLSGALTYLILMQWTNWEAPLFIAIMHGLIDWWKIKQERNLDVKNLEIDDNKDKLTGTKYFFTDQLLHLATILLVWLYLTRNFGEVIPYVVQFFTDVKGLALVTAFILIIWPVGIIIGKLTEPFRKEVSNDDSLRKAGTYIGISERILVLIFILVGQYAAIGFLIAGKSILRVGKESDKHARKKTEYVLIGTLISFTSAIVIGLITTYVISI
jgi:hypothetical protein